MLLCRYINSRSYPLQVQDADIRYAQGQANNPSLAVCGFQQRRMDRAHCRYLSAIKTLATVRKLALPVLQVNIAGQQVNVGQAKIASPLVGPPPDPA